jgi:L-ascorbate metabolism protein UlaG (beta-lactamase superfamily)
MKVTKYEHACFTVEENGQLLVVDPGNFTKTLDIPNTVVGVVITHDHADHLDPNVLTEIYNKNPDAVLVTLPAVADKTPNYTSKKVNAGDTVTVGPFKLEFFGGKHAPIHDSMNTGDNLGVLINDAIYYPGDSFALPNKPVKLLGLPVGGPWLKLGEVIDFVHAVDAEKIFPTHDFHNSEAGQAMIAQIAGSHAKASNSTYLTLAVGESLEI